jgi:subtilase family serine protease
MSRVCRFSTLCLLILAFALTFNVQGRAEQKGSSTARPLVTEKVVDTQTVTLKGSVPAAVRKLEPKGETDASRVLDITVLLKRSPEQEQALQAYLTQTHTVGNPAYGQTLTLEELGETFGVASTDIEAVTDWLQSHGLQVRGINDAVLRISVRGTIGQIQDAFGTEFHNYQLPSGRTIYSNSTEVKIPQALAPVVRGIGGLHNLTLHVGAGTGRTGVMEPGAELAEPTGRESLVPPPAASRNQSEAVTHKPNAGLATTTTVTATPPDTYFATNDAVALSVTLTLPSAGTATRSIPAPIAGLPRAATSSLLTPSRPATPAMPTTLPPAALPAPRST